MNESITKTIGVAFCVCLICSLVVSFSAVSLRDLQNENKLNDKRKFYKPQIYTTQMKKLKINS